MLTGLPQAVILAPDSTSKSRIASSLTRSSILLPTPGELFGSTLTTKSGTSPSVVRRTVC